MSLSSILLLPFVLQNLHYFINSNYVCLTAIKSNLNPYLYCLFIYIIWFKLQRQLYSMMWRSIKVLIIIELIAICNSALDQDRSVYTIPYTRTFRPDLIEKYIGCGYNVIYPSYTFPDGIRDMAMIYTNPFQFGGAFRCSPKDTYLKIFGYAQNYHELQDFRTVISNIQRSTNGKFKKIIIDWKDSKADMNLVSFLQNIARQLQISGFTPYVKVPASYLCRDIGGRPYILGISSLKRIIVQMYGQDPAAYKNINQIFTAQQGELQPNNEYPNQSCPKFPSYRQLTNKFPNIDFYIEKTLQQEESGFLGKQFANVLVGATGIYDKVVFYDAFPPNIIRL